MTHEDEHKVKNPRRDLYLVLAGFLDEIYGDRHFYSGGPFDLERFPKTTTRLLKAVSADESISRKDKELAGIHYDFCKLLYVDDHGTQPRIDRQFLQTHLRERKQIDSLAKKLLRSQVD